MISTQLRTCATALALSAAFFISACDQNKAGKGADASLLYGTDTKEWKISRETDAAGDRDKLTDTEKDSRLTFYSSGKFTASEGGQMQNGTFVYTDASQNLMLTPEGATSSENFKVEKISEGTLTLIAADGSKMTLKDN